jgi:diaminohydroxyphosphoribosylaminopyrimidine deaminase/5-amino-6-(5-phosphoribosylamino)uracil reductase
MVGTGTAMADDPELTCRLPGLNERSPVRVVLDRQLRLPAGAKLLATARDVPTWVITAAAGDPLRRRSIEGAGVEIIEAAAPDGRLSMSATLQALGARGITRLLVEGGSALSASLLQQDLVDRLYWFRSASVIGGDGLAAAASLGVERLVDAKLFARFETETLGADMLESYRRMP